MSKRRVVNGQTYIWTRRGWRQVKDGIIQTRRGWRKMRRQAGALKPAVTPKTAAAEIDDMESVRAGSSIPEFHEGRTLALPLAMRFRAALREVGTYGIVIQFRSA